MTKQVNRDLQWNSANKTGWKLIVSASVLFLWPLLVNGYPLVYSDTGTYVNQALELEGAIDRPPYYSLFIFPFHLGLSLWLIPIVQSIITAYILSRFVEVSQNGKPTGFIWYALTLSLGSSLPWFVCQIMPDFFAPVSVLIVVILAYHQSLSSRERWVLLIILTCALSAHLTHFLITLSVLASLSALGLFISNYLPAKRCYYEVLGVSILSCLAFVIYNLVLIHKPVLSAMSPMFLLARSLEDGPALRVLDECCPNPDWFLCSVRDRLHRTSNELLWETDSPFRDWYRNKPVTGVMAEASQILHHVIKDHPTDQARAAMHNFLLQLVKFKTGDFEGDYASPAKKVTRVIQTHFPNEASRFLSSAQVQNKLPLYWIGVIHVWTAWIALAISFLIVIRKKKHCPSLMALFFAILTGIVSNAFLTGVLSEPIDRYGSRIVWLLLLPAIISVREFMDNIRRDTIISGQQCTI